MLDEKLLSHWELERKKRRREGAKCCSILQSLDPNARGASDEITAMPTVTKESSNGDLCGSGKVRPEVLPCLLQPAWSGLQGVRGK